MDSIPSSADSTPSCHGMHPYNHRRGAGISLGHLSFCIHRHCPNRIHRDRHQPASCIPPSLVCSTCHVSYLITAIVVYILLHACHLSRICVIFRTSEPGVGGCTIRSAVEPRGNSVSIAIALMAQERPALLHFIVARRSIRGASGIHEPFGMGIGIRGVCGCKPVLDPLPGISDHVVETEGVLR